ncbi:lipase 2 [Naganishia albida]|nr:lipase 2 [Naganishia albida]
MDNRSPRTSREQAREGNAQAANTVQSSRSEPADTLANLLQDALETPITRSSSIDWSSISSHDAERGHVAAPELPPYITPLPQAHLQTLPHSHRHAHPRASSGLVAVGGDVARAPLLFSRLSPSSTPVVKLSGETIPVASVGLGETRMASIDRPGKTDVTGEVASLDEALSAVHGRPVRVQGHEQNLLSGLSQRVRQSPEKRSRTRSSTDNARTTTTQLATSALESAGRTTTAALESAGRKASGILNQVNIAGQQFTSLVPAGPFQREDKAKIAQAGREAVAASSSSSSSHRRPRLRHRSSSTSSLEPAPRHLQRTISSLLEISRNQPENYVDFSSQERYPLFTSASIQRSSSFTSLNFPLHLGLSRPTLPSLPSVPLPRAFSSSPATADAQGRPLWRTLWEGTGVTDVNKKDEGAKKKAANEMLAEEDKGDSMEESMAKIEQKYETPKNPLVFCHGLLGFDYLGPASLPPLQISHWRGIREVLEANGCEVMITRVPATSSTKVRSEILMAAIEEKYPGRTVNLIGHSMGGIDGRYMISKLKPEKFKVSSLTTISTPHKGSPFADYVIDNIIGRENLPSWLSLLDSLKLPNGGDGMAFEALGSKSMENFNEECPDDPDVSYFSWGACFEPGYLDTFRWSHSIIYAAEGPNDGLVSVKSAKHGEYQGTLVGVSHVDLVGWVNTIRYTLSSWSGNEIKFKPATFYLEVADLLAKKGF